MKKEITLLVRYHMAPCGTMFGINHNPGRNTLGVALCDVTK